MENIFIYENGYTLIIKHSGEYYPFGGMDDKGEVLRTIDNLNNNCSFYNFYLEGEMKKRINKLDFISLKEWLILN